MSEMTINHCDVKGCGKTSNQHLDLPDMVIRVHSTDGLGKIIVTAKERRFDLCQTHLTEFMESTIVRDALVAREKTMVQG